MKNNMPKYIVFIMFSLLAFLEPICAQKENIHQMQMLARPTHDSIILRWAPATYELWLWTNKYGYTLTRSTLVKDGKYVKSKKTVNLVKSPFKPCELNDWESLVETNGYAGVAAQAIFGDTFELSSNKGNASMIDIVNKATEQESRYGFALYSADMSLAVAKKSALCFVDKNVKKGEKYIYKIFPAKLPDNFRTDTAYYFTGVDEYIPLPAPIDVKAEASDKIITLTWDRELQSRLFNSFWIEKSDDNGKSFKRINNLPLVNTTPEGFDDSPFNFLIDSLANNNTEYQYRVIGISIFGEVSPPSDIVKVKGVSKITTSPILKAKTSTNGKSVILNWEFINKKNEIINGFKILRSGKYASGFKILKDSISLVQKQFVDKNPLSTGYYRIQAYNKGSVGPYNMPIMQQVIDSFPPAKPIGISAKADTTGNVILSWIPNKEKDIFAYRIYRANAKHEEFSQITKEAHKKTRYTDKINLKTLTKKVFYKIIAIDSVMNQSVFSDVFELERPDIVPPASPVITGIVSSTTGLEFSWFESPSPDVEKLIVYRNTFGEREWKLIKMLPPKGKNKYTDTLVNANISYRYIMIAVDKAGNESKPSPSVAKKYLSSAKIKYWITPKVSFNKKNKILKLSWTPPQYQVKKYLIYRKEKLGAWEIFDNADGNTNFFMKKSIENIDNYTFRIKTLIN